VGTEGTADLLCLFLAAAAAAAIADVVAAAAAAVLGLQTDLLLKFHLPAHQERAEQPTPACALVALVKHLQAQWTFPPWQAQQSTS
jgi:hypothetical protein